jgi:deazaflavin-dependent oxidoreductase (nitroreductase family)
MDDRIRQALEHGGVIDITTTGRKTRRPRRIEIWFHNLNGRLYITGLPGSRDWYANLLAHPEFTFHLKAKTRADLPARATPITDETRRRSILSGILDKLGRSGSLEAWVRGSPLVEVELATSV